MKEEVEEFLAEQEDAIVIHDSDFEPIQLSERKIKYRTFNGHSLDVNEDGVVQHLQSKTHKNAYIIPQILIRLWNSRCRAGHPKSFPYLFLSYNIFPHQKIVFAIYPV